MDKNKKIRVYITDRMVLLGFTLAAIYWILDSILYMFLSYDVSIFRQVLGVEFEAVWTRIIVSCLFVIFGSHAQYTINERRLAEEALKESEEKYRTIIESIDDGYFEADLQGRFTFTNAAMSTILGYPPEELTGILDPQIMDEENRTQVSGILDRVHGTGVTIHAFDCVMVTKYGTQRFVEATVSLIRSEDGEATGFRGVLRDVTERRRAEALRQAKITAESSNKAKSEFLANMSHEIRTPLNAIIGMVELLMESDLSQEQREDLAVVVSAAYALLSVINDILDFSKIEAGKLELEKTSFDLKDFLDETLRIMAAKAHEKNLELAYRIAPCVPDRLIGDPARFRQVVINLIGNAIKFTDQGEVVVSVDCEEQNPADMLIRFSVRDTGIGIPEDKRAAIFGAFEQADGSTTRRYGGTGLGLAVSSQLVGLMGGKIWVDSQPGQGSNFQFLARFGLQPGHPDSGTQPPVTDTKLSGRRVLIVDDNATAREIISEVCQSWHMQPETAADIHQARGILKSRSTAGTPIEMVLIDSSLPEDTTLSLVGWMRDELDTAPAVIMMLTHARTRAANDINRLGIHATVNKPIRPSNLLAAFMAALGFQQPKPMKRRKEDLPAVSGFTRSLKILVAEDTPFNQKFILRLLDRWHHRAIIAENGIQALTAMDKESFDLVLMDVQMPEMDGFEATAAIRSREKASGRPAIPIIAMTAHAMKGDRERCLEAGMDDYVSKPISAEHLMNAIMARIPEAGDDAPPAMEEAAPASAEGIDKDVLLGTFDNDWDFFLEAVAMFMEDYPPMLTDIQRAVAGKDAETLKRQAHALKGMVGNFQARAAAGHAAELEFMGRESDLDGSDESLLRLEAELERLKNALIHLTGDQAP